jgi:membrane-bound lytic murein transglycosylase MltF
LRSAK